MNIGYIRVSTEKQDLNNQVAEIERYILSNKMVLDKTIDIEISSKKTLQQRKIVELFKMLNENDNLIVCELSRLARSVKELEIILQTFKDMKITLILIKEGLTIKYDDDNPMTKMFLQFLGVFAEFERNIISMRTKRALQSKKDIAKKKGITLNWGHNKLFLKSKYDDYEESIYDFKERYSLSFEKICKLLDIDGKLKFKPQSLRTWFNKRYIKDNVFNIYQKTEKYTNFLNKGSK